MTINSLSSSLVGLYEQHHDPPVHQDEVTVISEDDFLARVAAFERNEEREAARAKETMKRMLQSKRRERERDGDVQQLVGYTPVLLAGASPTSQPPPAGSALYPFYELPVGGPPPLQDAYRDSLQLLMPVPGPQHAFAPPFLVRTPYVYPASHGHVHPYPNANTTTTRTNRQDLTGARGAAVAAPPDPSSGSRRLHDAGLRRNSPDAPSFSLQFGYLHPNHRHHHDPTLGDNDQAHYHGSHPHAFNPRSAPRLPTAPVPQDPPPRLRSSLAPPTSFQGSNGNNRGPSFRFDYDLRTNPAALRVSSSVSVSGRPFISGAHVQQQQQQQHQHNPPPRSATVNHARTAGHLQKSAFTPPQQRMTIICNLFPWIIDIQGSQSGYITVYDILSRVHEALYHPLTLSEWNQLPPTFQNRIIHVWSRALGGAITTGHSMENKSKLGWIERLGKYLVGRMPSHPTHTNVTAHTVGLDVGRADGKVERRLEQGLLRIDFLVAQYRYPKTTLVGNQQKGHFNAQREKEKDKDNGLDSIKWIGLVRDDVLATARGIKEPGELQRCWSLLLG